MVEVERCNSFILDANFSEQSDLSSISTSSSSDITSNSEDDDENFSSTILEYNSNLDHRVIEATKDRTNEAEKSMATTSRVVSDRKRRSSLDSSVNEGVLSAGPSAAKRSCNSFYVKLAPQESPWNSSREEEDGVYDSYNERETGE